MHGMQGTVSEQEKDRKARGIKGKKGDYAVIKEAIILARQLQEKRNTPKRPRFISKSSNSIPTIFTPCSMWALTLSRKRTEKAQKIFEKMRRLDNRDIAATIMLATIRTDQNRVSEALDLVQRAESMGIPKNMMARMGVLYRDTGQLEKARSMIEEGLKHDKEDTSFYLPPDPAHVHA